MSAPRRTDLTPRDADSCERCGDPIPPRTDPRGRKARFCSDACRAAASRERRSRAHAAELAQARDQMTLDTRSPHDIAREAAQNLREVAAKIRRGEKIYTSPEIADLIDAGHELDRARNLQLRQLAQSDAGLNRAQRRAKKRR